MRETRFPRGRGRAARGRRRRGRDLDRRRRGGRGLDRRGSGGCRLDRRGSSELELATAAHSEALPVRRALDDHHGEHIELQTLGNVAFATGDVAEAEARWWELVRLTEERGDDNLRGRAYCNLGYSARMRGDLAAARWQLERARELHQATGDSHAAVIDQLNLSGVLHDLGDETGANDLVVDVVRRAWSRGDSGVVAEALEIAAAVTAATGRPVDDAWFFGAAETPRRRLGPPRLGAETAIYERDVRRAREAAADLGQRDAFDGAWREGATATLEEAVGALTVQRGPEL